MQMKMAVGRWGWGGAVWIAASLLAAYPNAAFAQGQVGLSVSTDIVVPGASVAATVTGPPGQAFAVIGSSAGAGFSYGGVALPVGPDVVVYHVGTLDSSGSGTVIDNTTPTNTEPISTAVPKRTPTSANAGTRTRGSCADIQTAGSDIDSTHV